MNKTRGLIKALAILTASVVAVDTFWILATPFTFEMKSLILSLACIALLGGLGVFYTYKRPLPIMQNILFSTVFLVVLTNGLAMLSYLLVSINLPLQDANLAKIDVLLGYDWYGALGLANDHYIIGKLLTAAYNSSLIQVLVVVLVLGFTNRRERLMEFFTTYSFSLTAVIILSALIPAAGAYVYLKPPPELYANLNPAAGVWHLEHFNALRDGSMRHLNLLNVHGLVTFPSFHTALAVLTVFTFRGMGKLFVGALILNALVIASTLTEGGHYLIDVIAGGALALIIYAGVRAYLNGAKWPLRSRVTDAAPRPALAKVGPMH